MSKNEESVQISVIVPIYNAGAYLNECIDSILLQSYENFELILIDDGSSDESPQICDAYATNDKRVRCFHIENGGVSRARNMGIDLALGKYVLFVDSDDYLDGDALSCLHCNAEFRNSDIVLFGVKKFSKTWAYEVKVSAGYFFDKNAIGSQLPLLLNTHLLYHPVNKLIRTSLIKDNNVKFPESISIGEDLIFCAKLMKLCKKLVILGECWYHYRFHSETSLAWKAHDDGISAFTRIADELTELAEFYSCLDVMEPIIRSRYVYDCYRHIALAVAQKGKDFAISETLKIKSNNKRYVNGLRLVDAIRWLGVYAENPRLVMLSFTTETAAKKIANALRFL